MIPDGRSPLTGHAAPPGRNGAAPDLHAPLAAHDGASHDTNAPANIDEVDEVDDGHPALIAVAHALSALPRPPLSPVFRAQLHGELVRIEAQLSAESSRRVRGVSGLWIVRRFLRPNVHSDTAQPHRTAPATAPSLRSLRWPTVAIGLPVASALAMTILTAAGLAYAAERSRPGDALWPVHAALTRWRTGDSSPAQPDSTLPGGTAPTDPNAHAESSGPSATVVRRAERRPTATPGQAPKPTARHSSMQPHLTSPLDGPDGPNASGASPAPPLTRPDAPDPDAPSQPPASTAPLAPAGPPDLADPSHPAEPDDPPEPAHPSEPPAATDVPPPATPTPDPLADPDVATLTGTVRVRDGSAMAPLAGVVVSLARVAADFPSGCDPLVPLPDHRIAPTDADGNWTVQVPAGRWVIAVTAGCLGPTRHYLADFNGAVAANACSALTLPVVAGGAAPSAVIVIPLDGAPGCGPLPTATPTP